MSMANVWARDFEELSIRVAGAEVGAFSGEAHFNGSIIQYVSLHPLTLGCPRAVLFSPSRGTSVADHVMWDLVTDALYARFAEDIDEWSSDESVAARAADLRNDQRVHESV